MPQRTQRRRLHSSDRRTTDRIGDLSAVLREEYGTPHLGNPEDPFEDLVFLLLSPRTRDESHMRAYMALKQTCPDIRQLPIVPEQAIEKCLGDSGLARQKSQRLLACMWAIEKRNGSLTLDNLRTMDELEAETFLRSLPGVGIKIARCVMMYTLGHQVFPVDINVFRVLRRIGLVGEMDFKRDSTHDKIQSMIPRNHRYDLHVNLIMHGRRVCQVRSPKCTVCVVHGLCDSSNVSHPADELTHGCSSIRRHRSTHSVID